MGYSDELEDKEGMERTDFRSEETKIYFEAYAAAQGVKGRTKVEYWRMIGILCRIVGKDFLVLTDADASSFQNKMVSRIKDGELSLKTLRVRLYCYDSFADYLYRTDVINRNPFAHMEKPVVDDTPYTSRIPFAEDCDAMLVEAEEAGADMFLIFTLVLRMGLTTTDICDLKTANVILLDDNVFLYFFTPDSKKEERYIKVPEDVKGMVLAYKSTVQDSEYFFANKRGKKLNVPALEKRVRNIMAKAGLKKFSLKDLRNRAIYQMIHDGADTDEVALYTNLSMRRVNTFAEAPIINGTMLSNCPANLSKIKMVNE